jgi:hypothetical protein
MFSLSLLCKKNASHVQNYPCKYSLNWKPFRHKEIEFLPFLVVTTNMRLKSLIDVLFCKLHYGFGENRLPMLSKQVSFSEFIIDRTVSLTEYI